MNVIAGGERQGLTNRLRFQPHLCGGLHQNLRLTAAAGGFQPDFRLVTDIKVRSFCRVFLLGVLRDAILGEQRIIQQKIGVFFDPLLIFRQ